MILYKQKSTKIVAKSLLTLKRAYRKAISHTIVICAVPAVDAPSEFARRQSFLIDFVASKQLEWLILAGNNWVVLNSESVEDVHLDGNSISQY